MFIQIHALRSFPPHIPNRGDDGLAKRSFLGGVERQRISYQCHQRSLSDHAEVDKPGGLEASLRSTLIGPNFIKPRLIELGMDEAKAEAWTVEIMEMWKGKSEKEENPDSDSDSDSNSNRKAPAIPGATAQVLVMGQKEALALAQLAADLDRLGKAPGDLKALVTKKIAKKRKKDEEEHLETLRAFHALRVNAGFSGAMFGRMATGVAVSTVRRAVRFSDWETVHEITTIPDFFSTTDNLKNTDDGDTGSGHINVRELGSGVFYQHATIDIRQLQENTGLEDVGAIVEWIIRALAQIDPVGGRAASSIMEMGVQVGPEQPRSLANAFMEPVEGREAKKGLRQFASEQARLDGLGEPQFWLTDSGIEGLSQDVLAALES